MGSNKQLRKITASEKAILNTRGEALFVMGIITVCLSMLFAIYELAVKGNPFGYISIAMGYCAGFGLYSWRYQRTKGYLILGIIGSILTLGSFILFIIL